MVKADLNILSFRPMIIGPGDLFRNIKKKFSSVKKFDSLFYIFAQNLGIFRCPNKSTQLDNESLNSIKSIKKIGFCSINRKKISKSKYVFEFL